VPTRPDVPGVDAEGIFGVQTLADGVSVRQAVDEREPRRAVVVGGGYVGLEMAEALVRRGLEVALVDRTEQPMASTLDLDMGDLVADALRSVGVTLHLGEAVDGFEVDNGSVRAVHTANRLLPADIVVLGLGVRPNVALARDAGIAIGNKGGIVTDARMETSIGGVWSAGDCVESVDRITGLPIVVALGTHANKQGRVVGINATGGDVRFPGVVGTAVSKICVYEVARVGLTEREAADLDLDVVAAKIESTSRAGYYPGAAPIKVKVVAERPAGRLVGAQIVGAEGAAKRIDVLATAIWNRMTVDEVASLDLSYAPPFSPVWDPVLVAARKAADELG
jgi:NADPH-dependent 2,4-dienoyl-CoA reductase/sulfur reductase-like enzyme